MGRIGKIKPTKEVTLLPGVHGWPLGGYEFAGGRVGLGGNIDRLHDLTYGPKVSPGLPIVMGTLLLSSVGFTNPEIGDRLDHSSRYVKNVITGLLHGLGISQRQSILPAALRDDLLRIEAYGVPGADFRINPYRLTQLGLIACGVDREYIAQACDIEVLGLGTVMSEIAKREGVKRTGGCIAGAYITHQLDVLSGVPLRYFDNNPGQVEPMIPVSDWNALVAMTDRVQFIDRFRELGLQNPSGD